MSRKISKILADSREAKKPKAEQIEMNLPGGKLTPTTKELLANLRRPR